MQVVAALFNTDQRQAIRELGHETRLSHVLHILKNCSGTRKIASQCIPHNLIEMQEWIRCVATQIHLDRYDRERCAF